MINISFLRSEIDPTTCHVTVTRLCPCATTGFNLALYQFKTFLSNIILFKAIDGTVDQCLCKLKSLRVQSKLGK